MTTRSIVNLTIADTTGMKRVVSATNYARNPRGVSASGWGGSGGTGGVVARTYPTTGGPLTDAPSFVQTTVTTAPTGSNITTQLGGAGGFAEIDAADIGKEFRFTCYARASKATTVTAGGVHAVVGWYAADGNYISGVHGYGIALTANTWTALPNIIMNAPTGAANAVLQVLYPVAAITGGVAVGGTFDASAFILHKTISGISVPYLDGDVPGGAWLGTPHASRSTKIVGVA